MEGGARKKEDFLKHNWRGVDLVGRDEGGHEGGFALHISNFIAY